MKAITVEPKKPGAARLEDIPEPDESDGSVTFPLLKAGMPRWVLAGDERSRSSRFITGGY